MIKQLLECIDKMNKVQLHSFWLLIVGNIEAIDICVQFTYICVCMCVCNYRYTYAIFSISYFPSISKYGYSSKWENNNRITPAALYFENHWLLEIGEHI